MKFLLESSIPNNKIPEQVIYFSDSKACIKQQQWRKTLDRKCYQSENWNAAKQNIAVRALDDKRSQ